jgi:hypothetical protein
MSGRGDEVIDVAKTNLLSRQAEYSGATFIRLDGCSVC